MTASSSPSRRLRHVVSGPNMSTDPAFRQRAFTGVVYGTQGGSVEGAAGGGEGVNKMSMRSRYSASGGGGRRCVVAVDESLSGGQINGFRTKLQGTTESGDEMSETRSGLIGRDSNSGARTSGGGDCDIRADRARKLCGFSCCCGGQLFLLWRRSSWNTTAQTSSCSVESSPYRQPMPPSVHQSVTMLNRTGSVSTSCSIDTDQVPVTSPSRSVSYQYTSMPSSAMASPLRRRLTELARASFDGSLGGRMSVEGSGGGGKVELVGSSDVNERKVENDIGKIEFSLRYDFQQRTLNLKIIGATELPIMDLSGTSDPYVKVMLLPDKQKRKLVTNIKRKTLNPRWNETFAFEGFPYSKLKSRILHLQVLDYDRFSRDDPIGEINQPLCDVDLVRGQTFRRALESCKGYSAKLGELLLSLCYQPTAEILTIVVIEARNLKSKDINGLSDPYVKIWLLQDGKRIEKRKTTVLQRTLNPIFNETFMFQFPYERVRNTNLVISVMDHDRMGRNEPIGHVVLGSKSGPTEMKHWNEMFARTRQSTERWHLLKNSR